MGELDVASTDLINIKLDNGEVDIVKGDRGDKKGAVCKIGNEDKKGLNVYFSNAHSLRNKFDELKSCIFYMNMI